MLPQRGVLAGWSNERLSRCTGIRPNRTLRFVDNQPSLNGLQPNWTCPAGDRSAPKNGRPVTRPGDKKEPNVTIAWW